MQVKVTNPSASEAVITVVADIKELGPIKEFALARFQGRVKLAGFREGKAPLDMIEKNIDTSALQTEFLEEAVSQLYRTAVEDKKIRVVSQPQINIKKFVPFSTLEFEATVPVIGDIVLADYKKVKVPKKAVSITAKDIEQVLGNLQKQMGEKKKVTREARDGDEVIIDFSGVDDKGQPINGATGKDYPLTLGSNMFIPGFEKNLIGMKAGKSTTFALEFPKDYGVPALASKSVNFTVKVNKVQAIALPKLDDAFAAKAGPFKSLAALKADIKKQLELERQKEADKQHESDLVRAITAKSKVTVPKVLTDDQIDRMLTELRQNLAYRGQTIAEFLDLEAKTEEEYRESLRQIAEERVKASLVLAEVADKEKIEVQPEMLDIRIQALKSQYTDQKMLEELEKPEARQEISSRLLTEQTLDRLVMYNDKNK